MIRLKELRLDHHWNMKETAEMIGIPYTTYISYEKGEREPNYEMLLKLASFFDVSTDYLLGNVSEPYMQLDTERMKNYLNSYSDDEEEELNEVLTELRSRSDMRMLFKVAKDATPEDVRQAVRIIEALRRKD